MKCSNNIILTEEYIHFFTEKLQNHHKRILQKYVSTNDDQDDDDSLSEGSEVTDFFEASPDSPLYTVIEICPEVEETKEVIYNYIFMIYLYNKIKSYI